MPALPHLLLCLVALFVGGEARSSALHLRRSGASSSLSGASGARAAQAPTAGTAAAGTASGTIFTDASQLLGRGDVLRGKAKQLAAKVRATEVEIETLEATVASIATNASKTSGLLAEALTAAKESSYSRSVLSGKGRMRRHLLDKLDTAATQVETRVRLIKNTVRVSTGAQELLTELGQTEDKFKAMMPGGALAGQVEKLDTDYKAYEGEVLASVNRVATSNNSWELTEFMRRQNAALSNFSGIVGPKNPFSQRAAKMPC